MTWFIKNDKNKYLSYSENVSYWTDQQSGAVKFDSKEEAKKISNTINQKAFYYNFSRVVRFKAKKVVLFEPRRGTIFLDLTMPAPEPNIITHIYTDRAEYGGDDLEYVFTTNTIICPEEDSWGTLEEYNEYLANGKIKVIWEPK